MYTDKTKNSVTGDILVIRVYIAFSSKVTASIQNQMFLNKLSSIII